MSVREVDHGPTVVDGVVRRTSVSALQMADASSSSGCLRKWWFDKVAGKREPSTKAQENGTTKHAEIEAYLRTGEGRPSDQIIRNLHLAPAPGPDLLLEHPMIPVMPDGTSGLHLAPLRVAGIPMAGFIDVLHDRRTNEGADEDANALDPPGTLTVIDWKFPGSLNYALTGPQLIDTLQMSGYGKYVFNVAPATEFVRLTHVYMPTKGAGRKATALVRRDAVEKSWEHAEGVARSVIDAARETDPEKVPANRRACRAYNKQCMHAAGGYCSAGVHNSLRDLVATKANVSAILATEPEGLMGLNILDRIRQGNATPSPAVAIPSAPAGPTAEEIAATKAAEITKLQAEEAFARDARAFAALSDKVIAHGMGYPHLDGNAAELSEHAQNPASRQPSGALGASEVTGPSLVIPDYATLAQLLAELDAAATAQPAPTPAPDVAAILSPETPATPTVIPVSTPAPTAPAASLQTTIIAPVTPPATTAIDEVTTPKRRGRPPKAAAPAQTVTIDTTGVSGTIGLHVEREPDSRVILIVDATVEGVDVTSLHGLVDDACAQLCATFHAADVRCAPQDGPLGFAKWRGALASKVREAAEELTPGVYTIDTRGNEITEIAVGALAARVRSSGGYMIRGIR